MLNLNNWTIFAWMGVKGTGFGGVLQGNRVFGRHTAGRAKSLRSVEVEAYAELDPALAPRECPRALAHRVCATVSKHSAFQQVAVFLPDAESGLQLAGSSGVDELDALAVSGRVDRFARERRKGAAAEGREFELPMMLDLKAGSTADEAELRQVIVLPMWSRTGEMMGALAVWRRVSPWQNDRASEDTATKALLGPVQVLAETLGRSMDLNRMSARLLGRERQRQMSRFGRLSVV